jgi:hypothetical protein
MYEGRTYYFSSVQDPSETTSVYGFSERFALAMFQHSAPTLLAYGGTYANDNDVPIKNREIRSNTLTSEKWNADITPSLTYASCVTYCF